MYGVLLKLNMILHQLLDKKIYTLDTFKSLNQKIMTIVVIIVCIALFIWATNSKKKIDEEEKVALKTPGQATRLRENFGDLITLLLQSEDHYIKFERSYDESIRIGNSKNQELFLSYSSLGSNGPKLLVACIEHSILLKELKFDKSRSTNSIYQEISDYFL